jgi:hypothetical protein
MSSPDWDATFTQWLAEAEAGESGRAAATLKSRLYSALVREQQKTGPLLSLEQSHAAGHALCIFEKLVQIAPVGESAKSPFFCSVCHARVLAESLEHAPIYWPGCPYVRFQHR